MSGNNLITNQGTIRKLGDASGNILFALSNQGGTFNVQSATLNLFGSGGTWTGVLS